MEKVLEQLDRERLIEIATRAADIVSITGEESEIAHYLGGEFEQLGMEVKYQEVEEGRPNVIGTLKGSGGGATLMFCAHMDHFDNPQPTVVTGDRIYGRGLKHEVRFSLLHRRGGDAEEGRSRAQRRHHRLRRGGRDRKGAGQ